jgi:peroxiredoxin
MDNGRQRQGGIRRGASVATVLASVLIASPVFAGRSLDGDPAPDFVLKSLSGNNQRLSEYHGSVVVLTLWAPWCGECRELLPQLNAMQLRLGSRGLQVLSVGVDRDVHRVEALARGLKLDFPVLLDVDKQVARLYDPGKMPLTLLIDPTGTVRSTHQGYSDVDAPALTAELEQMLADYGPLSDQG